MRALLLGLLVALALVAAGCGDSPAGGLDPDAREAAAASTTTTVATTTTTLPPGGRVPSPEDPLRVLLAGDSVMAGLAPAAQAALESDGAAQATYTLLPSLPRGGVDTAEWQVQLDTVRPEVVVFLVGVWERTFVDFAAPGWQGPYSDTIVEPLLAQTAATGARVLWVGMPAVPRGDITAEFAALNEVYARLATASEDGALQYVDAPAAVAGPAGEHTQVVGRSDGSIARLRQIDGTHLCADGAILIAREVQGLVVDDWSLPVASGWTTGSWRDGIGTPSECPPT